MIKSQHLSRVLSLLALMTIALITGCKKDDAVVTPPTGFTLNTTSLSVAGAGSANVTVSGGTAPYTIQTGPDTSIATATISGSTITVTGVAGGFTTIVVTDAASASLTLKITVTGAITFDIFPIVLGRTFTYAGWAISTSGVSLPDPSRVYSTTWTVGPTGPVPGSTVLVDTTTLQHPAAGVIGVKRNLLIIKNPANGDFIFFQTLGPFFRAFGITRTDTVRAVLIAKPSSGIGGTWVALDSTYTSPTGNVRLEINGEIIGGETITDSSTAQAKHNCIKFRTWRRITVGSTVVVPNSTTSELWLEKNIGPIQVHIAQDSENLGHFRTLRQKNF